MTTRPLLRLSLSLLFLYCYCVATPSRAQTPVTWINLVNVTVSGAIVQKTTGCDGCQDGAATSQEQLNSDGYVEFTVGELNTMWMAGLSNGNDDYAKRPKGNLDVTGRYFIWTTNLGGNRLDAFLVKIPAQRLTAP